MRRCSENTFLSVYGDMHLCESTYAETCEIDARAPGSGMTPTSIDACAHAESSDCAQILGDPALECTPPGTRADGDPCARGAQCRGRLCAMENRGDRCGRCAVLPRENEPCYRGAVCSAGLACWDHVCKPKARLGEACAGFLTCEMGLDCVKRRCSAHAKRGEACDFLATEAPNCDDGATCVDGRCVAEKLAQAGSPCGQEITCIGGTYCSIHDGCRPEAHEGERCNHEEGPYCMAPAVCVDSKCRTPHPAECL